MPRQWFVAQAVRNKEIAASLSAVQHGFTAYVPIIQRRRRVGLVITEISEPRFGTYIFVKFDRDNDDFGVLYRGARHRAYFTKVLCNADGKPSPVPEEALEAVRSYEPPPTISAQRKRYAAGDRVVCLKAGMRMEAVFVGYCGNRPMVRTWIFGAERVMEVSNAEIEPLNLDGVAIISATGGG